MSGPAKTPTETLKLRGSKVAIYERGDEPDAPEGYPDHPEWMPDEAVRHWDRMCPLLDRMRLLSPAYREALAMCCVAWADYERLEIAARDEPGTIMSEKGGVYLNPALVARDKARDSAFKLLKEFGLTPASKANCTAEGASSKGAGKKGLIRGAS